jgi:hypothetical protein
MLMGIAIGSHYFGAGTILSLVPPSLALTDSHSGPESTGVGEGEAVAAAGSKETASDSLQGCSDGPTGSLPAGPRGESESRF